MLVAGPSSVCDVCLEPFGCDGKAPCSISCGHVFCVDCLDRVTRPNCPLCRNYFDSRATVKLHLDLDIVRSSPAPTNAVVVGSDEQDARRLHQAISNIAEEGCSESQVRQLISDGKSFLQKHPRDSFKDLRTLHRMVAYLCEVKTNLRAQNTAMESIKQEMSQLQNEKAELMKKIKLQLRVREEERQHALAIELSLREHCSKAHEAYTSMVDQYNYVAKEWTKLNDEIKRLRMLPAAEDVPRGSPSSDSRLPALELDQAQLNGAAVRGENSILISPLPQFTNRLNTTVSIFMPLPDVEEGDEDEDDDDESSEESDLEPSEKHIDDLPTKYIPSKADPSEVSCNAAAHPYSCNCVGFSVFGEVGKRNVADVIQPIRPASVDRQEYLKPALADWPPSGLARTAPRYDVRRARSYSNPSQSSSRTQSSSRSVSRSPSPPVRSPAPPMFGAGYASPLAHDFQGIPQSPPSRAADSEGLRSRLQSILSDTPQPSSSPPKVSNLVSASVSSHDGRPPRTESQLSQSRSPSPPEPSNLRRQYSQASRSQQQQINNDKISKLLASHQHPISGTSTPLSTSPNARTSSASDAARALEQSKRDRQQTDKGERQRRKSERDRSSLERETERIASSSSSSQASASAAHTQSTPVVYAGGQHPGSATRPSTNFNPATVSKVVSASSQHQYTPASQPRYPNATNSKAHSSIVSLSHSGMYSS